MCNKNLNLTLTDTNAYLILHVVEDLVNPCPSNLNLDFVNDVRTNWAQLFNLAVLNSCNVSVRLVQIQISLPDSALPIT